ncbi:MAG: hypothetical protein C0180_06640 [Aciduliprofundum sp.]|nr:MAG: hypothetical protein C0180_06640 [Aciduliprofundum sp.]
MGLVHGQDKDALHTPQNIPRDPVDSMAGIKLKPHTKPVKPTFDQLVYAGGMTGMDTPDLNTGVLNTQRLEFFGIISRPVAELYEANYSLLHGNKIKVPGQVGPF